MSSEWYFPPAVIAGTPNTDARSQAMAPYGASSLAIAGFAPGASGATLFSFDTASLAWSALRSTTPAHQYVSVMATPASGVVAVGYDGLLTRFSSSGTFVESITLGDGVLVSALSSGASGFAVNNTGSVYSLESAGASLGSFPVTGTLIEQAFDSGTEFVSVYAGGNTLGLLSYAGVQSGTLAGPAGITKISCASAGASAGDIVVAGWAHATLGSAAQSAIAQNPANPLLLIAASPSTATVFLNSQTNSNKWSQSTQVAGLSSSPVATAWSASGTQAFISDTANGVVNILTYVSGSLSLSQSISLAGPSSIVAAADGISALVSLPSSNEIAVLQLSGSTWSQITGDTLSVSGAGPLLSMGASVLACCADGVAVLGETASTWSVISTIALSFAPTAICADAFNNVYVANATNFAEITGGAVVATASIPGASATGMIASQSQIAIIDSIDGAIRVVSNPTGSAWSETNMYAATGALGICQAGESVIVASSDAPPIFVWVAPYRLEAARTGSAGIYDGSSWVTQNFGNDVIPSAAAVDPSGNYWVACEDNSLFQLNSAGTVIGTTTVPNYPGMATPLGVSSLVFAYGHMYAGCSMFGGLIQVS